MKKEILVAGHIPFSLGGIPKRNNTTVEKKINELAGYLMCFLSHICQSNDEKQNIICTMLENAEVDGEKLYFAFPQDIRTQFHLNDEYCVNLNGAEKLTHFYCEKLCPHLKLCCDICFHAKDGTIPLHECAKACKEIRKKLIASDKIIRRIYFYDHGNKTEVAIAMHGANEREIFEAKSFSNAVNNVQQML